MSATFKDAIGTVWRTRFDELGYVCVDAISSGRKITLMIPPPRPNENPLADVGVPVVVIGSAEFGGHQGVGMIVPLCVKDGEQVQAPREFYDKVRALLPSDSFNPQPTEKDSASTQPE